jgi:S1-C subfamily serine protease
VRRAIRRLRSLPAPSRRRVRVALLATFVILLGATAAYAVISDSSPTKHPQPVAQNGGSAWLGVELANAPVRGALVSSVIPGSPAAAAGIRPGDLITQLDTEPIVAPAVFVSALSGLQPGDRVDIQVQRGFSQFTAHVKLGSHPVRSP